MSAGARVWDRLQPTSMFVRAQPPRGNHRPLFRYAHEQSAGQFAVFTNERRVIGLVVSTKNGRWAGVGVFFDQGFVGRAIRVKLCIGGGFAFVHQGGFGSDKILTVIRKDTRVEFGLRQ